jgi:hypothetical protein
MINNFKISPESIFGMVSNKSFNNKDVGVYSQISKVLTGETYINVPIFLTQSYIDIGYYSEFDGAILQKETVLNFTFSGITEYEFCVNNTSLKNNYTKNSEYIIDWGDDIIETFIGDNICHTYNSDNIYNITLKQVNNFGTNIVTKSIKTPFDSTKISDNPKGKFEFIPSGGPWKDTPIDYEYIFDGDSNFDIDYYTENQSVSLSGFTKSKLNELSNYGVNKYKVGKPIYIGKVLLGQIDNITTEFTAYTINDISYIDYKNSVSVFIVDVSGLTKNTTILSGITKNDVLMKSVSNVQIFSNVFIERGKISGYEKVLRLGEVKNIEELENYGYGFFNLANK